MIVLYVICTFTLVQIGSTQDVESPPLTTAYKAGNGKFADFIQLNLLCDVPILVQPLTGSSADSLSLN